METLHVFDGQATDDIDKLSLVTPILGLYAELYACADDIRNGNGNKFLSQLLDAISAHKSSIFPQKCKLISAPDPRLPARGLHGHHHAISNHAVSNERIAPGTTVVLFGELLAKLEHLLDTDAAVRDELRRAGLQRRGIAAQVAENLARKARLKSIMKRKTSTWTSGSIPKTSMRKLTMMAKRRSTHANVGPLNLTMQV